MIETQSQLKGRMIVCLCRAKSDGDVLKAIDEGASSIRDLQRCGIGTDCGSCHGLLRMMLADAAAAAAGEPCPQCAVETSVASPA